MFKLNLFDAGLSCARYSRRQRLVLVHRLSGPRARVKSSHQEDARRPATFLHTLAGLGFGSRNILKRWKGGDLLY